MVTVTVETKVDYRLFPVPTHVIQDMPPGMKQDGIKPLPKTLLKDADDRVIDALVHAWLDEVYTSAGQRNPWRKGATR